MINDVLLILKFQDSFLELFKNAPLNVASVLKNTIEICIFF